MARNVITDYYTTFTYLKTYPQHGRRVGHYQSEFVVYVINRKHYVHYDGNMKVMVHLLQCIF
jgi:hypothetical protein